MPEVISKRALIMRRLKALVQGINPTNDDPKWAASGLAPQAYSFDLSRSVYTGKMLFGTEVRYPAVAILEAPQVIPGLFAGDRGRKDQIQLLVQGFADSEADGEDPTEPAYELMAAVEVRLQRVNAMKKGTMVPEHPTDYLLGGLLDGFVINKGVVRPPEEKVSAKTYFYLPVTAFTAVEVGNPYVALP